ncbi:UNVERIFIED_CONTAM: RimJ/RimL family protein N-acetyltransferase [Williamsia faeni]
MSFSGSVRTLIEGARTKLEHMDWPRHIPTLTDRVITLRPLTSGDAPSVQAASQDPLTAEFTVVPSPYTAADARDFVDSRSVRVWPGFDLAIVDDTNSFLGLCGLRAEDDDAITAIGYAVAPWARGRGIATRTTRLLIEYSWQIGAVRVGLDAYAENAASRAVARKCGFIEEGILRSAAQGKNGRRHDLVMHGLLRTDPGA